MGLAWIPNQRRAAASGQFRYGDPRALSASTKEVIDVSALHTQPREDVRDIAPIT